MSRRPRTTSPACAFQQPDDLRCNSLRMFTAERYAHTHSLTTPNQNVSFNPKLIARGLVPPTP